MIPVNTRFSNRVKRSELSNAAQKALVSSQHFSWRDSVPMLPKASELKPLPQPATGDGLLPKSGMLTQPPWTSRRRGFLTRFRGFSTAA